MNLFKDVFPSWQKICKQQFHLENVEKTFFRPTDTDIFRHVTGNRHIFLVLY